jgi:3',5'-cyclic AMP phosphodiesterase CpdA
MRRAFLVAVMLCTVLVSTPARATTVKIAAAGDIVRPRFATPQQQTADLITAYAPTAVFALGDEQYEHGELANFQTYYQASWGAFKSKTYPVPGNHEYETPGASGYYQYFGSRAGSSSKGYYSFNIGDWHVVALNTECSQIDCSAERTWARNDLNADTHLCEMAIYHRTKSAWPLTLMAAAGGDVVLAGHRHSYERYPIDRGISHFTVGTGGDSLGTPDPSAAFGARAYGVIEMSLTATGFSWKFVDVGSHVLDSGSRSCH